MLAKLAPRRAERPRPRSPRSWTYDESASFGELELGPHLDVSFKPILRSRLRKANWERERYLWARIGYTHLSDLAGAPQSYENRGILELTCRIALPGDVWAVNRGRVDLHDKDGESSTRYRYSRWSARRRYSAR